MLDISRREVLPEGRTNEEAVRLTAAGKGRWEKPKWRFSDANREGGAQGGGPFQPAEATG
jgi:hypothetical protein